MEEDRRTVVGFQDSPERGLEGIVHTPTRIVRGPVPRREAAFGAPLSDQEALPLGTRRSRPGDAPRLGGREGHPVQALELHQRAARPAIVVGRSPEDPAGARFPCPSIDQPTIWPWSASIAYRNRPSSDRSSSRSPGLPSSVIAAVASSSVSDPSMPIAKRETAP